ncbi:hypothetical protein HanXRQr2_Chr16g0742791 [Helianthus annuus]|uniref:Uncharacterized protein n=1 Tax=Helianthus annuus TaxID=4232 RepID=A0A9K3GY80_HELAN|nr:hypothetical protein HanXRQr2_Chr16g0742791 [Helianthus annuus]
MLSFLKSYKIKGKFRLCFLRTDTFIDTHPCLTDARLSSLIPQHPSKTNSSRYCNFKSEGKHFLVICHTNKKQFELRMYQTTKNHRLFSSKTWARRRTFNSIRQKSLYL